MDIKHTDNLWGLFGVAPGGNREQIDRAYMKLRDAGKYNNAQLRVGWKTLRDPYFSHTYDHYRDMAKIFEAGFFDDLVEPEQFNNETLNPFWLTTPAHKIRSNLDNLIAINDNGKEFALLLSTGSFSPIHSAHIDMMEAAKKEVEARYGIPVLGGYISPSHDGYVSTKFL